VLPPEVGAQIHLRSSLSFVVALAVVSPLSPLPLFAPLLPCLLHMDEPRLTLPPLLPSPSFPADC
jgi:hypothetical protein